MVMTGAHTQKKLFTPKKNRALSSLLQTNRYLGEDLDISIHN